jgi:hypothetical protein
MKTFRRLQAAAGLGFAEIRGKRRRTTRLRAVNSGEHFDLVKVERTVECPALTAEIDGPLPFSAVPRRQMPTDARSDVHGSAQASSRERRWMPQGPRPQFRSGSLRPPSVGVSAFKARLEGVSMQPQPGRAAESTRSIATPVLRRAPFPLMA